MTVLRILQTPKFLFSILLMIILINCNAPVESMRISDEQDMKFLVVPGETPEASPTPTPDIGISSAENLGIILEDSWELAGDLGFGRWGHTATILDNGSVLVVGGSKRLSYRASAENQAKLMPFGHDQWFTAGTPNWERTYHTATLLPDGRVLVVGGSGRAMFQDDGEDKVFRGIKDLFSSEIYEPNTNKWVETSEMNYKRSRAQAISLADGDVMIIGGRSGVDITATTEIYRVKTRLWEESAVMNHHRMSHSAVELIDGRVLVTGGLESVVPGETLSSAEIYDPYTKIWTVASNMHYPRLGHQSTLLSDGRVLITGGATALEPESKDQYPGISAEIYDPSSDTWTEVSNMDFPRQDHVAILISEIQGNSVLKDKVILFGGANQLGSGIKVVEEYNVQENEWSRITQLPEGRTLLTATFMEPCSVLIVGGGDVSRRGDNFPEHSLRFDIGC
ncbi:MAG: hypothetical protein CL904_05395 [Dehalococcoidia bacterium]|nr:hypothetical protein [Dehalococcoidia bacterium]MQG15732.1 hypothetical protein [SAR202 cluster bacterium]